VNDVSISTHLIETSHLSKRYGNRFGLKDADLNVENHEIFALMGPNGAGKSTLLRILATLTRPTSGEVKIFGYDILKQEIQVRRLIGVVLHHSLLYDELSGRENLSFYMRLYGFRNKDILKKSIKDKASLFGVEDRLDDHVGTLSSGLKKRFDIVRAIIHNPRILLLDEPFSSLDLEGVEHLKNYLNWAKGSSTIIFSTHNLDIAEEISDRIATLKDSQITEIRCIK
jgi:ABC-type multidrug transport system ATPase subunit